MMYVGEAPEVAARHAHTDPDGRALELSNHQLRLYAADVHWFALAYPARCISNRAGPPHHWLGEASTMSTPQTRSMISSAQRMLALNVTALSCGLMHTYRSRQPLRRSM